MKNHLSNHVTLLSGVRNSFDSFEIKESFEIHELGPSLSQLPASMAKRPGSRLRELIWIRRGCGNFLCERNSHLIGDNSLIIVSPGHSYIFQNTIQLEGFRILFANDFLADSGIACAHVAHLLRQAEKTCFLALSVNACQSPVINAIVQMLSREQAEGDFFKSEVQRNLLKILLIQLSRHANIPSLAITASGTLVTRFMQLLNEGSVLKRAVSDYASDLAVTRNHLNATIRKETGKSTRFFIHQRMIDEAKYWATYSPKSMKQIAYELGFDDICHFSKFFKQKSGLTFSNFRSNVINRAAISTC